MNLINRKTKINKNFKKNTNFSENSQKIQRYDSLNFVDKQTLNNAITKTTKKINDNCQNINLLINGKNYNYKDQLLNVFNNKETLLKTNN